MQRDYEIAIEDLEKSINAVESALSDTVITLKKAQDALTAAYNQYCKMKTYVESVPLYPRRIMYG